MKKEELELFVWSLNRVETKIKFKMDLKKEGFLPFLDVGITKFERMYVTKVCREPTHTTVYSLGFKPF